jgi:hypothetical protein
LRLSKRARPHQKRSKNAQAKLAPLEVKAVEAQEHVVQLMGEFNRLTGKAPAKGRTARGKYNQTVESKLAAQEKRSFTRAVNGGATEAEAKKIAKEAVKKLSLKLGVK